MNSLDYILQFRAQQREEEEEAARLEAVEAAYQAELRAQDAYLRSERLRAER